MLLQMWCILLFLGSAPTANSAFVRPHHTRAASVVSGRSLLKNIHQYAVSRDSSPTDGRTTAITPTPGRWDAIAVADTPDEASAEVTPALRQYQAASWKIASSFEPNPFRPLQFLTNCHLQTIAGVYLRRNPGCDYVGDDGVAKIIDAAASAISQEKAGGEGQDFGFWDERERIDTMDGDFFHADTKYHGNKIGSRRSDSAQGMVIIIHGLQSSSNSSLCIDMAESFLDRGLDVTCLNFRGCCGNPNITPGAYHLGFTDDLKLYLDMATSRWREEGEMDHPLYLSGFSLGANVVLKSLGEMGEEAITKYGIRGAAVAAAPFDNERNQLCVEAPGFNRMVYSANLLTSLKKNLQMKVEECEIVEKDTDLFDYERCMSASTIAELETELISPLYGFKDNIDYYRKTSCLYFLDTIAVPALIVNAADDPFFDREIFPLEKSCERGGKAPIKMVRTEYGGHIGYLFHQQSTEEIKEGRKQSWLPVELSRFIDHVQTKTKN